MTDDQGFPDMGCHGNPVIQTPHMDRLAETSARLDDFHVNPFCSPTRSALMTGQVIAAALRFSFPQAWPRVPRFRK